MRSSLSFLRGGFIRLRVERRKKKKKTLYNIRRPCSRDEKTQWGFGSGDALHANSFMHSEALCSLMKAELINLFLFSRTFPHPPPPPFNAQLSLLPLFSEGETRPPMGLRDESRSSAVSHVPVTGRGRPQSPTAAKPHPRILKDYAGQRLQKL